MEEDSVITNANADSGSASSHNELDDFQPKSGNPPVVSAPNQKPNSKQAIFTELIIGTRETFAPDKNGQPVLKVIIKTESGKEVWVTKSQFNPNAETVTFRHILKGQVWFTDTSGNPVIAQRDIYQFEGSGRQIQKVTKTFATEQEKLLFILQNAGNANLKL